MQNLSDSLTDKHICLCLITKEGDDKGPYVLANGDAQELSTMLGLSIVSGLQGDNDRYEMANKIFDIIENAVVGLMAYNDDIYDRVINHIMQMPGKPCMIAKLNK